MRGAYSFDSQLLRGQVECDEYCREVLRSRMREGHLHEAEIKTDVRHFHPLPHEAQGLIAGFPCQAVLKPLSAFFARELVEVG